MRTNRIVDTKHLPAFFIIFFMIILLASVSSSDSSFYAKGKKYLNSDKAISNKYGNVHNIMGENISEKSNSLETSVGFSFNSSNTHRTIYAILYFERENLQSEWYVSSFEEVRHWSERRY
ncbi:hypothetical protein [Algivirga pacifica]|uniref:Uncharacterized protein n=1 Tax=Algivirga pacifica TaxID=1162670 RepID=A0ABP9DLD1_9BACT